LPPFVIGSTLRRPFDWMSLFFCIAKSVARRHCASHKSVVRRLCLGTLNKHLQQDDGERIGSMRKMVILGFAEAAVLAIVAAVLLGIGSGYV
jgi:hypothetical protein